MNNKFKTLFVATSCVVALTACNSGNSSGSSSLPPLNYTLNAFPTSESGWEDTGLGEFLAEKNYSNPYNGNGNPPSIVRNQDGIFLSTTVIGGVASRVIFYNTSTHTWSDVTGNLSGTGGLNLSSNRSGLVYVTLNNNIYVYAGSKTWKPLSYHSSNGLDYYYLATYLDSLQSLELYILTYIADTGTQLNEYQIFKLNSDLTTSPVGNSFVVNNSNYNVGTLRVSPNGANNFVAFTQGSSAMRYIINGITTTNVTSRAAGSNSIYAYSNITNNGDFYVYPRISTVTNLNQRYSLFESHVYQCNMAGCNDVSSVRHIFDDQTETKYLQNFTELNPTGSFAMTLTSFNQESAIVFTNYACDIESCVELGQALTPESSFTEYSNFATIRNNNRVTDTPLYNPYIIGNLGYMWLQDNQWVNTAPSGILNNESFNSTVGAICAFDSQSPVYMEQIELESTGYSYSFLVNGSDNNWIDITKANLESQSNMTSNVSNLNYTQAAYTRAATYYGPVVFQNAPTIESSTIRTHMSIYNVNYTCPAAN